MSKKGKEPSGGGSVQVFELTMDNPEDQDELNRRLRKPGESHPGASPKNARAAHRESPADSGETKKRKRKGSS